VTFPDRLLYSSMMLSRQSPAVTRTSLGKGVSYGLRNGRCSVVQQSRCNNWELSLARGETLCCQLTTRIILSLCMRVVQLCVLRLDNIASGQNRWTRGNPLYVFTSDILFLPLCLVRYIPIYSYKPAPSPCRTDTVVIPIFYNNEQYYSIVL
jgi:hypothetical protein